jgi:KRAB domain-containing zinc finger protein
MKSHIDLESRRYFACNSCEFVAVSKESLRGHQAIHRPKLKGQVYECSTCFESFADYNQLYRHRLKVHVELENKHSCSFCGKTLKGASALRNHITLYHQASSSKLKCPFNGCLKICVTTKQLQNHLKTHNEDAKEICSICGLVLANKHNLDKHINRIHLKLRNFNCDICGYCGFFKFNIVEHVSFLLDQTKL